MGLNSHMGLGENTTGDLVVLGDCATNGSNTMLHEIFQDPEMTATFSIQYHLVNRKHVMAWYLKHRARTGRPLRLNEIEHQANAHQAREFGSEQVRQEATREFNREFQMDPKFQGDRVVEWYLTDTGQTPSDFEDPQQLRVAALKHLNRLEEQRSWVHRLEHPHGLVHNYSVNGNHFGNYLVRIRKHVAQHGRPRLVLITDYEQDHIFTNVWHAGQRYTALMSARYLYMEPEDQTVVPEEVYNLRRRKYVYEKNKPRAYRERKSRRYQALLEKYLEQEGIPYLYVLYMQENLPFVAGREFIDLRHIYDSWFIDRDGHRYPDGHTHNCRKKLETQAECAKIVQERINALLRAHKDTEV